MRMLTSVMAGFMELIFGRLTVVPPVTWSWLGNATDNARNCTWYTVWGSNPNRSNDFTPVVERSTLTVLQASVPELPQSALALSGRARYLYRYLLIVNGSPPTIGLCVNSMRRLLRPESARRGCGNGVRKLKTGFRALNCSSISSRSSSSSSAIRAAKPAAAWPLVIPVPLSPRSALGSKRYISATAVGLALVAGVSPLAGTVLKASALPPRPK